jgi:hypothetical protein
VLIEIRQGALSSAAKIGKKNAFIGSSPSYSSTMYLRVPEEIAVHSTLDIPIDYSP